MWAFLGVGISDKQSNALKGSLAPFDETWAQLPVPRKMILERRVGCHRGISPAIGNCIGIDKYNPLQIHGLKSAEGGTRTRTVLLPGDFKSPASAYSATPASGETG